MTCERRHSRRVVTPFRSVVRYALVITCFWHLRLLCAITGEQLPQSEFDLLLVSQVTSISDSEGYVYVLFFNEAYLEKTKSWVCNIQLVDAAVISKTVFITSNERTAQNLRNFVEHLHVFAFNAPSSGSPYGTYEYFEITRIRLKIQSTFIEHGANVFLIESDSVWLLPVGRYIDEYIATNRDSFIPATDRESSNPLISAGFLYVPSSEAMFFKSYYVMYSTNLRKLRGVRGRIHTQDPGEQHLMTKLLHEYNERVLWLEDCNFARGTWYSDRKYRSRCPRPRVIQNNYIISISNKVRRAKKWKHWFLDMHGTCISIMPNISRKIDQVIRM